VLICSGADGSVLFDFVGAAGVEFGGAVASAGDIDGDGIDDVAIGAPADGNGTVSIHSGATGALLRVSSGATAGSRFGAALANLGDLDGDGVPELAVGAPKDASGGTQLGLAVIYSGANGGAIAQFSGATVGGGFGSVLDDAGDVDGDGIHDLLVVEQADTSSGPASGTLRIVSGATFATLQQWTLGAHGGGWIASGAGDVNGDGRADVIVGNKEWPITTIAPYISGTGGYWVLDGATGATLYSNTKLLATGFAVASAGDVNGDGYGDFAFGLQDLVSKDQLRIRSGKDGTVLSKSSERPTLLRGGADLTSDGVGDLLFGNSNDSTNGYGAGAAKVFDPITRAFARVTLGTTRVDFLGRSTALLDDVDGDGVRDVLAATGGYQICTGMARILSGVDGSEVRIHAGSAIGDGYALQVASLPDVDGDSIGDYAISHSGPQGGSQGLVEVRSGATGNLIRTLAPAGGGSGAFGECLAVGIQPSGAIELAVGSPGYSTTGAVFVFDAATGSLVVTAPLNGAYPYPNQGSVAWLGDVDGDGVGDWAAGIPSNGSVVVFSGSDGKAIQTLTKPGGSLGYSVCGPGDLDGDGIPDLVAGSPWESGYKGNVYLYSGATWSALRSWSGTGYALGASVTTIGDVDGDGRAEFLAGQGGNAFLISGGTGAVLYRFDGAMPNDFFGWSAAAVAAPGTQGSMNGDSIPDVAIGATTDSSQGYDGGRLSLYFLDDLYLQVDPTTAAAGDTVSLTTGEGPAGALTGLFAVAFDSTPEFLPLLFGTFGSDGTWALAGTVPPGLAGHSVTFRSYSIGFAGKLVESSSMELSFD
jgi:VCBS repeat protein/FG-GAP repeat protein